MSDRVPITTRAQTPADLRLVPASQDSIAVCEHEAERPDIATQEGAARLGRSLGAIRVDGSAPPIIQRKAGKQKQVEQYVDSDIKQTE